MTRSRAHTGNMANALMAEYYSQRATAGMIITEGTSPSPNGFGYARVPGLFNEAHVVGWKLVTDAVHAKGGKIIVQLMHTGRVSNVANLPEGAKVVGPSAVAAPGEIHTDSAGMLPYNQPRAMSEDDIKNAIAEFANAARLAIRAGFDGVELHGASGYLLEQFFNATINQREDQYGGSPSARNRFVLEVVRAVVEGIGADRVGIRFSPHAVMNGIQPFAGMDDQFIALTQELSALGLMYVHVVDYGPLGMPPVPAELRSALRQAFDGPFILTGGFERASAENALAAGQADMIAFGRPFVANPDLVERMRSGAGLNEPDATKFYSPGAEGYTDYPSLTVSAE